MSAIRCMLCVALWIWSVILPWTLLGTVTTIIAGFLLLMYPAWDSKNKDSNGRPNKPRHEKWFYAWLIGLSVLGGFWALFLPLALNQKFDGPNADGNQLRLHLLYITGGVLALTTLGETHRKNTVDREKAKVEKDNYEKSQNHQKDVLKEQQRQFNETIAKERERIEVDKAKNEQDHIRQVHAERHSRYTTAIEQLSSDKASIRLGGVYTLIGLADEWLTDKPGLHQEGQVIVNNLCAYIRSPFDLASKAEVLSEPKAPENYEGGTQQFTKDQARIREEKEIRRAILTGITTRLNGGTITEKDGTQKPLPGPWSCFDYNFSNAIFFYPANFSNNYFGASSEFSSVKFTEEANFSHAIFINHVGFSHAIFINHVGFSHAIFINRVDFSHAKFAESANFFHTTLGNADFSRGKFIGDTNFSNATFKEGAYFSKVIFVGEAKFYRATFTWNAEFIGAIFFNYISFSYAIFKDSKPLFADNKLIAKFSDKVDPLDYNFEAAPESPHKIKLDRQKQYIIPKGADLFNPDDPSMQGYLADEYNYYHLNTTTTSNNVPEGL